MSVILSGAPINEIVIDSRTGKFTRPWLQWFSQGLWMRVGQAEAMSNDELSSLLALQSQPLGSIAALLELIRGVQSAALAPAKPKPADASTPTTPAPTKQPSPPDSAAPVRTVPATSQPDLLPMILYLTQAVQALQKDIGTLKVGVLP